MTKQSPWPSKGAVVNAADVGRRQLFLPEEICEPVSEETKDSVRNSDRLTEVSRGRNRMADPSEGPNM